MRAVMYMAQHAEESPYMPIRGMAAQLDMPFHYLTKALQDLTKSKILVSSRGAAGGVALARPADEISLLEIIDAVEGADFLGGCLLGAKACNDRKPCPLHKSWSPARKRLKAVFSSSSLADLAQGRVEWTP